MSAMPSYNLGNGVTMPGIGLGTWQCSDEEVRLVVLEALRVGYRHIDTAWLYKCEQGVGDGIKDWVEGGGDRKELCVVTKLPPNANRAEDVERLLNKQLGKLGLDYVDLYLIHGPMGWKNTGDDLDMFSADEEGFANLDNETDLVGLWKGMETMVMNGKAKTIGVSNFNEKQIERIIQSCKIKPVNNQVEVHAYFSNKGIVEYCKSKGITVCAYAPLGSPSRGERIKSTTSLETQSLNPLEDPVIVELSQAYKKTPGQILLRHLLQRGIAIIPKSGNPSRIKQNFDILDFELKAEDFEKIEKLDKKQRFFPLLIGMQERNPHPEYPF
eukprot:GFUD01022266.1.p1 GENE.GFUD01022266.1~~GFUD01022266.1.p1  ORF type:complete len:327 (-),score=76.82 GFUD01022266.1:440-1420(-)